MIARVFHSIGSFLRELKRRKVYRVAVAYAAGAFVVIQVADLVFPALGIPAWAYSFVVIAALVGFPIALVLAWAFEVTAEGNIVQEDTGHSAQGRVPNWGAAVLVAVSLALAAIAGYFLLSRLDQPAELSEAHSLAVLPFKPIGQSAPSPFMDGVHDDLLTRLSAISDFRVIARSSVARYRDSDKSVAEIADELNVQWVLEGGVQQSNAQVKVNVQLIDPRTQTQEWSESYQTALTAKNLFGIQSDITRRIASALQARLSAREVDVTAYRPTDNLPAYRLLIEARTLLAQRAEPEMRRALQLFRRATELDPAFALAWVGVADAIYELIDYGFGMPDGSIEEADAAARRATDLDVDLPEARVALGLVSLLRHRGPDALMHIERATRMRPNYAEANSKISWVGQILGRPELAFEGARRAIRLDPLSLEPRVNLALGYLIRGESEQALAAIREKRDLLADWPTLDFYEGVILYHLGRYDEAIDLLEALSIAWAGAGPQATLAVAQAAAGRAEQAEKILAQLEAEAAHPFLIGLVHLALYRNEAAFSAFESARDWRTDADWPILAARYLYPALLDPARADPRFRDLLRRIDDAWMLKR